MSTLTHSEEVLTHLDAPDRPFLNRTAPELVTLFLGLVGGLSRLHQADVAVPLRLAEAIAIVAILTVLALYRPHGRALTTWARLAWRHWRGVRLWVHDPRNAGGLAGTTEADLSDEVALPPPHLAALGLIPPTGPEGKQAAHGAPPNPTPSRDAANPAHVPTQDLPFVPREIGDDVAVFADGRRVALLECDGPPTALLDADGQRAAHAGAHEFLQGLATPLQVEVALTPVDLRPYAAARAARLPGLPLDLRRLESADIAFMRREARRRGLLAQRTLVVVADAPDAATMQPTTRVTPLGLVRLLVWRRRARGNDDAAEERLDDRCAQVVAGLEAPGVPARRLDTGALTAVFYGALRAEGAEAQPLDPGHDALVAATDILFAGEPAL